MVRIRFLSRPVVAAALHESRHCVIPTHEGHRRGRMKRALLALTVVLGTGATALAQQDVADFYRGKTIRMVVGVGVGSGYDINARAVARHMSAHIPGNPTVIVQNQPGAGSVTMVNGLYNTG